MNRIPVDLARVGSIRCITAAEPQYVNRETGEVKTNRAGRAMWQVGCAVRELDSRRGSTIEIRVVGEPVGIEEGELVTVTGLVAFVWEQNGGHGVSFTAESITPATGPDTDPAPAPGPVARGSAPVHAAVKGGKPAGGDAG